ncbi:tetratricopeptide repeat protein [Solimonas marina]|uniref:Sel1 repeat family protein n=1 Tax=Solimonas marina TaxID=2714601 RepID=A0A969W9F2_9GAMM|nr:tetratricopeptide repeat protein [Solimonas marina]NKF22423.1 hypothetical protein [Solimonas marina]
MKSVQRTGLPARGLIPVAVAALVFGVGFDAWGYGNHLDKNGEGVLVHGAQGLPDIDRGQEAAREGRLQDAETDLKPLAQRGYVEAQISLAKLYVNVGTPDRIRDAIGWLRTARSRDPLDTEVPLGRLLAEQADDASIAEGEKLLDNAWQKRRDPDALAGLLRLYTDHPELDTGHRAAALVAQAEKIPLANVQSSVIGWYRSTRAVDDHERKLAVLCTRWVDSVPECYVDLARNARVAEDTPYLKQLVADGSRKYDDGIVTPDTLASLARVLVVPIRGAAAGQGDDEDEDEPAPAVKVSDVTEDPDEHSEATLLSPGPQQAALACTRVQLTPTQTASSPSTPVAAGPAAQTDLANALLKKMLNGPDESPVLAASVVTRYSYLLPNTDIETPLKQAAARGDAQAQLALGQLYMIGARAQRDPQRALRALLDAAQQPDTAIKAHYLLGRLYAYGYLGESEPLLAAQYLMWSARRGYASADRALARLFVNGKGVCPNLENAYVFARLGAEGGSASSAQLEQQIAARLPAVQMAQAQKMYVAESQARPSAYQIPQTLLARAQADAASEDIDAVADDAGTSGFVAAAQPQPSPAMPVSAPAPAPAAEPQRQVSDATPVRHASAAVDVANTAPPSPSPTMAPVALRMDETPTLARAPAKARVADETASPDARPPAPPVHEIQLSHTPSSDPAVRRLLEGLRVSTTAETRPDSSASATSADATQPMAAETSTASRTEQ